MEIINCAQNSPEWLQARLGIPTASAFSKILAKGEGLTRRSYMMQLAAEIITGEASDGYSNEHMQRGHEQEQEARELYAFQTGLSPETVGFVRDGRKGCSPDALIDEDGGAEIKTRFPHLQADLLCKGEVPTTHKAQIQGSMWVCRRQWWDFVSFCPRMPLFVQRVYRDEVYIQKMATEVDLFVGELDAVVAKIRGLDQRAA